MAPRETENNAYAKFRGDKRRALWYVMVIPGVVNWGPIVYYVPGGGEFSKRLDFGGSILKIHRI